jgi:uncharacterized protein (DUF885 family)
VHRNHRGQSIPSTDQEISATVSPEDKQRLTEAIITIVNNEFIPAYKQFSAFVTSDYIPYTCTVISIESLPDGKRRYQSAIRHFTTTSLPALEIHATGLRECDRIIAE